MNPAAILSLVSELYEKVAMESARADRAESERDTARQEVEALRAHAATLEGSDVPEAPTEG